MTSEEALIFVNIELKGLWPDWNPTDAELKLWQRELMRVDYEPTKYLINNWYITQNKIQKRPFLGQMRRLFKKIVSKQQAREAAEPVLLYEIVKQTADGLAPHSQRFFLGRRDRLPESSHNIEDEAERNRERFNQFYDGDHVIIRHWESLYTPTESTKDDVPF